MKKLLLLALLAMVPVIAAGNSSTVFAVDTDSAEEATGSAFVAIAPTEAVGGHDYLLSLTVVSDVFANVEVVDGNGNAIAEFAAESPGVYDISAPALTAWFAVESVAMISPGGATIATHLHPDEAKRPRLVVYTPGNGNSVTRRGGCR